MPTPRKNEVKIASYGSNLDEKLLARRCGAPQRRYAMGRLLGYRYGYGAFHDGRGAFATVIPEAGAECNVLVHTLGPRALASLDDCEGVAPPGQGRGLYTREPAIVRVGAVRFAVEVYVHCGNVRALPYSRYVDGIRDAYAAFGWDQAALDRAEKECVTRGR